MAFSYPTSIDSFTNPSSTSPRNNPSLAGQQSDQNGAINAIETKIGTGSSTPVVNTVLRGTGTGTSSWAQVNLATDVTGTLGSSNGGTGKVTLTQPATGSTLTIVDGKTLTANNSMTLIATDSATLTFQGTDTYVGRATTDTLTNKRVTKRTGTVASSATPTINTDNVDYYSITALAVAITSFTTNLSGTPTDDQTLWISITDNGTARAIIWGASFEASGNVALPTTTVISTRLDVGFVWNTATSKWRCVAVS